MKASRNARDTKPAVDDVQGMFSRLRRERFLWLVPLLLVVHASLATLAANRQSITFDEAAHLPAGYTYLSTGDFRVNPEHPPLLKMIGALPLLWMDLPADPSPWINGDFSSTPPIATQEALALWRACLVNGPLQYSFGHYFLYPVDDAHFQGLTPQTPLSKDAYLHQADSMLFWSRLCMTMLSVALGCLVFAWTYERFHFLGGIFALILYCFEPNFLAHAPLITTDVGVALFLFGSMYFLWRTFQHLSWFNLIALAICSGCAVTSKFSGMLLLPLALIAGGLRIVSSEPWYRTVRSSLISENWQQRTRYVAYILIGVSCWTYLFLWACYGFRFNMVTNPELESVIEMQATGKVISGGHPPLRMILKSSVRRRMLLENLPSKPEPSESTPVTEPLESVPFGPFENFLMTLNDYKLLPEAYIYGVAYMHVFSHGRGTFLRGDHSPRGFRSYFLWTTLLKTPLPILVILATGLVMCVKRAGSHSLSHWLLLAPVLLYTIVTWGSHINIGHRHLLPMFPFLIVMAGQVATLGQHVLKPQRDRISWAIVGIVVVSTQFVVPLGQRPDLVYPNYLSYFNEIAGGPRRGHESLVDSNLDWGQGVKQLAEWLHENKIHEPIALFSFGMSDPQYAGLTYINVDDTYPFHLGTPLEEIKGVEYCAVHATVYEGAYLNEQRRERLRNWLAPAEQVALVADSILVFRFPSNGKRT